MVTSHTPDEVRRIARQFAAAEAEEVVKAFIRRQDARIAACRRGEGYGTPEAAYAAALGHQAAKAQAEALIYKIQNQYKAEVTAERVLEDLEREFSDL